MFKQNVNNILSDLSKHKRNKQELLAESIKLRLNKSLHSYYKDLTDSYTFLSVRNEIGLARKLNRS